MNADQVKPHNAEFTKLAAKNPAGLNRPMLSLDDTAVALTFLPVDDHEYTYLHLRRDLSNICAKNNVEVASKYYNTSSHITFARFATQSDLMDKTSLETWIQKIDSLNQWLRGEYWPSEAEPTRPGLRWDVGTGRGVEIMKGTLWYGDGKPVAAED